MSEGKRFWGNKAPDPFTPTDSSFQRNYALHRAIGDIPSCTPAVDVFVSIPLEVMRVHTARRAAEFCDLLQTCDAVTFKNHPFHKTDVALNVIKNPAAKSRLNLYNT